MRLVVSIASILLTAAPALAATITLGPQKPDRPNVVMVEGLLVADDEDQFGAKTASLPSAFVAFSSDGGSLVAGLRIGEAIRRKGFSTIVPDGQRCASACALAWLGGVERFIGTDGKIGFHAAYDSASDGDAGIGNTVVSAYLAKIGLPYEVVIYITRVPPAPQNRFRTFQVCPKDLASALRQADRAVNRPTAQAVGEIPDVSHEATRVHQASRRRDARMGDRRDRSGPTGR
jgi:hypothetical protein